MIGFGILTLFPEMFPGPLGHSLTGTALENGLWSLTTVQLRDFGQGRHRMVDDTPYGGGAGMVMKPEVIAAAIEAGYAMMPGAQLIYLTPRGRLLDQAVIAGLMRPETDKPKRFLFLCGRFEGVDERVLEAYRPLEISIGDYILCGGELAAMVMMEAMLRYVPGVLGNPETHREESFQIGEESACLLEYPHYTKPSVWEGKEVPNLLTSGNHARIASWRRMQAEALTRQRRPDLWARYTGVATDNERE